MVNKQNNLSSRHPKIIMVMNNEEDGHGVSSIISNQTPDYRAILKDDNTDDYIKANKPSVILFALSSVDECISYYSYLVEKKYLDHIHYGVLLCKNKESAIAYRCCMQGLFDNYFVYQPLYEKYRLLLIISSGLAHCQSKTLTEQYRKEQFDEVDKELDLLITQGSQCKLALMDKISQSKNDFEVMQKEMVKNDDSSSQSTRATLQSINNEYVQPLLHHLEGDIKSSLEEMLAELLLSKNKTKEFNLKTIETVVKPCAAIHDTSKQETVISEPDEILKLEAVTPAPIETPLVFNNNDEDIKPDIQKNILVVEDNKIYRDMLEAILAKENYNVDVAEDGLCALKKIKNHVYDLIIMDLFMPNLDGLNTTKKIRNIPIAKNVPVIALASNKNKKVVQQWANYGLKCYILKPSTKKEILSKISKVLQASANEYLCNK